MIQTKINKDLIKPYINRKIKNWKTVCNIFNTPVTSGASKIADQKELKRHFAFTQVGVGYIFTKIYKEPLPSEDKRLNNMFNSTYGTLLDDILNNYFYDITHSIPYEPHIEITFAQMFTEIIPFFTDTYTELRAEGYAGFAKKYDMTKGLVKEYSQHFRDDVIQLFETVLNRLQRFGIITWDKEIIVKDCTQEEEIADKLLKNEIEELEKEAYQELKLTYNDRANPAKNKEFRNYVIGCLDNVMNYWRVYSIDIINKPKKKVKEDQDELIQRFIKTFHNGISNTPFIQKNKDCIGKQREPSYPYRSQKNQEDLFTLTNMLWNVPDNLCLEFIDFEELEFEELFNKWCDEPEEDEKNIPF